MFTQTNTRIKMIRNRTNNGNGITRRVSGVAKRASQQWIEVGKMRHEFSYNVVKLITCKLLLVHVITNCLRLLFKLSSWFSVHLLCVSKCDILCKTLSSEWEGEKEEIYAEKFSVVLWNNEWIWWEKQKQ